MHACLASVGRLNSIGPKLCANLWFEPENTYRNKNAGNLYPVLARNTWLMHEYIINKWTAKRMPIVYTNHTHKFLLIGKYLSCTIFQ